MGDGSKVALKPRQITKDVVRATFAEAVRALAPQSGLEEWYFEVSEGSGVGRDVIRRLARDADGPVPEALTIARLTAYFGPKFADEWLAPLTGVRCAAEPADSDNRLNFLASELEGLSKFARGAGEVSEPGPAVSELADRRRA